MNFSYELDFLCGILKKCRIFTSLLSPRDTVDAMADSWFGAIIGAHTFENITVQSVIGDIENTARYKYTSAFGLRYTFMRIPVPGEKNILFIGPYLSFPLTAAEVLEIGENLALDANVQKKLKEYYDSLPILPENDRIFTVIDAFCERIWQTSSFAVLEITPNRTLSVPAPDTPSVSVIGSGRQSSPSPVRG